MVKAKRRVSAAVVKSLKAYIKLLNAYREDSDEHRNFLKKHQNRKSLMRVCHTVLVLRRGMADGLVPLDHYKGNDRRLVRRFLQRSHTARVSDRLFGLSKRKNSQ